jgi:hypothetical protein
VVGRDQEGYPFFRRVPSFRSRGSLVCPGRPPRPIPGGGWASCSCFSRAGYPCHALSLLLSVLVSSSWSRFSCHPPSPCPGCPAVDPIIFFPRLPVPSMFGAYNVAVRRLWMFVVWQRRVCNDVVVGKTNIVWSRRDFRLGDKI